MKMKINRRLLGFAWFIFVLVFVSSMVAAAFFLTRYLYNIIDWHPSALLAQVITTLLGLLFTGLMIGGIGQLARKRGWIPEMNVFRPIIEALEKIAAGDFSIRVESEFHDNQIVG